MQSFSVEFSVTEKGRKSPKYTLDTDLNGEVSLASFLEFTKANLIIIADQVLREEQARGFDPKPVVVVDGRQNKPVISVNPLGKLEFFARAQIKGLILEAYNAIRDRSPVDTGQYVRSNYVFLNGKQVANSLETLNLWLATNPALKQSDLIRFVNITPYARRLERLGVTAQRQSRRTEKSRDKRGRSGGTILAPNGTYFLAARAIKRKYKNNSRIKFSFIPGSSLGLSASFKMQTSGARDGGTGKRKKPGSTYLYPSITIGVSELGVI